MYYKGFINIAVVAGVLIILSFGGYLLIIKNFSTPAINPSPTSVLTPTPAVSPILTSTLTPTPTRGPNPTPTSSSLPVTDEMEVRLHEGERGGSLLVEKIYSDYITGLNFWEYPIATNRGYPVTLHIGDAASNGCTIMMTLIRIEDGIAVFHKKTDFNRPCPICLAKNTLIDTPMGLTAVQDVKVGMTVWTKDQQGSREAVSIMAVSKTPVPPNHRVVHLKLEDGRELWASPGHSTSDKRRLGDLRAGGILDNSPIELVEKVSYAEPFTYDILPAGETGFYWANGILLGSTLLR